MCLFAKRLERHKFVWPPIVDGTLTLTPAQLALLIEAMDWRRTVGAAPLIVERLEPGITVGLEKAREVREVPGWMLTAPAIGAVEVGGGPVAPDRRTARIVDRLAIANAQSLSFSDPL